MGQWGGMSGGCLVAWGGMGYECEEAGGMGLWRGFSCLLSGGWRDEGLWGGMRFSGMEYHEH